MTLTSASPATPRGTIAASGFATSTVGEVYLPQQDTELLIDMVRSLGVDGKNVLDLCTGSGAIAIAAARRGAAEVTAVDASADAVAYARRASMTAGVSVTVEHGDLTRHVGQYDVVTCNPPYVPTPPVDDPRYHPAGPSHAWDAGLDGRAVLDLLCAHVPTLLRPGGAFLLVHSEFADEDASLRALRAGGLHAEVVSERFIPFGPVMTARAEWLEERGLLERGCRVERLVGIAAVAPGGEKVDGQSVEVHTAETEQSA
ncbi:HemK2/MTQ2 family protein methyltransferase [Gordonia rubripertincta]|uniref:Methyltransferase n=1 Tax=Gordonia rubripertincta TaxID=36822 RepID=A0AAW4G2D2_GORRU|nr:HemK2/MTQ2 family protein methyltransferase [Gordonia rubripertincta]ASR02647.1 50S ribosomal protein L3 glutamine methyltransferase [Gordonia rubripertincta]MBM7277626.1 methyltransferase [Gordonia rubripertincta]QMU20245.1 methyltransferase [Gordonia rubripertincta]